MKNVFFAICALVALVSTAAAGDAISKSTLSNMGLGSMQTMSDNDGMSVRGKGTFAGVWGTSAAQWNGQSAQNSYEASAQWVNKASSAHGESKSFAGNIEATYAQDPTGSALSVHFLGGMAGGSAKAFAH